MDDDVDPAEGLDRLLHESLEIVGNGHVSAYRERAQPVGFALEDVAAAREHGDVRAFLGERLGDPEPDAGRGAADDRGASLKPEIHG